MKRCARQHRARNSARRIMANPPKLRISPFGLLVTNIEETDPPRQRSKHDLPCNNDRCRNPRAAIRPSSWLDMCILAEEAEAEDAEELVSIH